MMYAVSPIVARGMCRLLDRRRGRVLRCLQPHIDCRQLSSIFRFAVDTTQRCCGHSRPWHCRMWCPLHNRARTEFQAGGFVPNHYFGSAPRAISSIFLPWLPTLSIGQSATDRGEECWTVPWQQSPFSQPAGWRG